jgi:segregation and condensation protein B
MSRNTLRNTPLARLSRERGGRNELPANRRLPALYRFREVESDDAAHGELARDAALAQVEAALMAADEPLSAKRLATVAGLADAADARRQVQKLQALYDKDGTAFQVEELAGGYQLLTRPAFHPWLVRVRRTATDMRLSPAARETLAIVAYRQPITRADVESIRGVGGSEMLRQLMEKGLLRIAGRDESLGRPVLYSTTKKFLQLYGLKSLRELPQAKELAAPERTKKKGANPKNTAKEEEASGT